MSETKESRTFEFGMTPTPSGCNAWCKHPSGRTVTKFFRSTNYGAGDTKARAWINERIGVCLEAAEEVGKECNIVVDPAIPYKTEVIHLRVDLELLSRIRKLTSESKTSLNDWFITAAMLRLTECEK